MVIGLWYGLRERAIGIGLDGEYVVVITGQMMLVASVILSAVLVAVSA
jgi:hypothetical protein